MEFLRLTPEHITIVSSYLDNIKNWWGQSGGGGEKFREYFLRAIVHPEVSKRVHVYGLFENGELKATGRNWYWDRSNVFCPGQISVRDSTDLESFKKYLCPMLDYLIDVGLERKIWTFYVAVPLKYDKAWGMRLRANLRNNKNFDTYIEKIISKNTLPNLEWQKNMMADQVWPFDVIIRMFAYKQELRTFDTDAPRYRVPRPY